MGQNKKTRQRRSFTDEFKRDATNLALESDRPVAQIADELGVKETTLGNWVRTERKLRDEIEAGGLDRDERAELAAMRTEVAELRMERDLLKRTVAFWVKESTP